MTRFALITFTVLATTLAAAVPAPARPRLDRTERAVIRLLNETRAQHGLPKLRAARPLSRAADGHSRDMLRRDFFDHVSSDGTPFDRRVRRYAKASAIGETLAALPRRRGGAARIVRMWMDSPPHRATILAGSYRRIGVARRWGSLGSAGKAVVTADFTS